MNVSRDSHYRVRPISKDEDLEMHLKKQPDSCFTNNYFDVDLKAWQANMNIGLVFNEYKAVTNMCQYFKRKLKINFHMP